MSVHGCIITVAIMVLGQSFLHAQRLSPDESSVVVEAREFFEIGDYLTVRKLLEPYVTNFNADPELMYFYGGASFYLQEYHKESFPFLKVAYRMGEMRALYIYVRSLIEQYRIEEAEDVLEQSGALELGEGRELYGQVQTAKRLMADPVPSLVEGLGVGVNSKFTEHSPLITQNDSILYFTSRRPIDKRAVQDMLGRYDENIYRSLRTPEGWSMATPLEGDINDILNDAAVALMSDEERMIVFKTARDLESSDLYIYERNKNDKWRREEKLDESINSESIENGLTANTNANVFIVSSDREGGFGGMDLYRVVRFGNGEWSEPINLGSQINTAYDEISPTLLLDDQTLFFSRNGPESMGGFDIFRTTYLGDTSFADEHNVGYPINSTRDDLHIAVSPATRRVYITRSKERQPADYDIHSANLPGFNLRATVFRFQLKGPDNIAFEQAEVSLFTEDFSEIRGMYSVSREGDFVVVLLPGESGVLGINLPGVGSQEIELRFQGSDGIQEIHRTIQLRPDAQ